MARTTGVDILNIKPDGDLGLGSDTNIPVPAVALDQVNKANQDIRLYDHQRQLMKYDHELKQQDNLLKGLSEDAVAVGTILPEDMDAFKEAEAEDRRAFLSVKSMEPDKNGQNREYDDYVRKHQHLKDTAATLQARYVAIEKLRQARAQAVLPEEQKALDEHIAKEIARPKGDPIRPFQKPFTMDLDKMVGNAQNGALLVNGNPANVPATTTKTTAGPKGTTVQTTVKPGTSAATKPVKGALPITGDVTGLDAEGNLPIIVSEPDQKWDYRTMLRNTTKEFVSDEAGRVNQQRIYDIFQGNNADIPKSVLAEWNKRLANHDQSNEIPSIKIPGNPGPVNPNNPNDPTGKETDTGEYPNQINYRDVGGKIVILDDVPTFNAKVALANVKGDYVVKGKKSFDEAAFKLNLEKSKAKADVMLKGAQAQEHRAKAGWYYKKIAGMNDDKEKEQVINDGYNYNLFTQPKLAVPNGKNGYDLAKIPSNNTTPIFTWSSPKNGGAAKPSIIKPIGSKTIYGTDPANPATYGKAISYEGGYYDQQYILDGKPQSGDDLARIYRNFKESNPNWDKGFDEFLKLGIKNNKIDVKIIGENGSTTRTVHTGALKALSNTNSKKGQDQPFYESFDENDNE